jgi:hypothetical protein
LALNNSSKFLLDMHYEIQIKLLEFSDIFVLSGIETYGIMNRLEENR